MFTLLERHALGLTKFEIIPFANLEPAALERRVDIRVDEYDRPRLDAVAQDAGEGSVHLELVPELRRVVHDADSVAKALSNAIRTSTAQIDKASAKELKAGLEKAAAGLAG